MERRRRAREEARALEVQLDDAGERRSRQRRRRRGRASGAERENSNSTSDETRRAAPRQTRPRRPSQPVLEHPPPRCTVSRTCDVKREKGLQATRESVCVCKSGQLSSSKINASPSCRPPWSLHPPTTRHFASSSPSGTSAPPTVSRRQAPARLASRPPRFRPRTA